MLTDLEIRDVGVIDHAAIQLQPGLNVVTGETGAGKTMIVSGLAWLSGDRADRERIRPGATTAIVQGRLEPVPATAADWTDPDDEALVLVREVGPRSRARIGGRLAPVSALAEVLDGVVEIHSQHESVRLASPQVQRALLDRYGGASLATARAAYDDVHQRWRAAVAELAALDADTRDAAREADRLAFELGEIDAVDPQPGEEDELDAEIARLEHAEVLRTQAAVAAQAITAEGGVRDALGVAAAALRDVADLDPALAGHHERLGAALAELQDLALDLQGYADDVELDPARLEHLRDRRAALARLTRKYGPDAAAVVAYAEQARATLATLSGGEARREQLQQQVTELHTAVLQAGAALREARTAAGAALAEAVERHLAELAMPDARLVVAIAEAEPGPTGADELELRLAANPGQPPLSLGKAASGGERSRVALALRLALADADDTAVVVFDEVDAGIGGRTALAVGRKLADLARTRQVLCVTHLPQLAAFADAHFRVSKEVADGATRAVVEELTGEARVEELSRMLSGTPGSATARDHARELMALAAGGA